MDSTNNIKCKIISVNLKKVSDDIISLFENKCDKKGVKIFNSIDKNIFVLSDMNMLSIILQNVIDNAIKYSSIGGVITLKAENENNYVKISVTNSGVDISDSDLSNILDDNIIHSTYGTDKEKGCGLGLSICKQFLKMNSGYLDINNKIKNTTEINLYLPKSDNKAIMTENADNNDSQIEFNQFQMLKSKTILIVEDNDTIREDIKKHLSKYFIVLDASNGLDAWNIIESKLPDLIISDIEMPEMDGLELCKKVKNNLYTSAIKFIILSTQQKNQDKFVGFIM